MESNNSWNSFSAIIRKLLECRNILDFDIQNRIESTRGGSLPYAAAFLLALGGNEESAQFLKKNRPKSESSAKVQSFLFSALRVIQSEIEETCQNNAVFKQNMDLLHAELECDNKKDATELLHAVRAVFYPEGSFDLSLWDQECVALRERRVVDIEALNPSPVTDPANELLFTSNVLLTLPSDKTDGALDGELREECLNVSEEKQLFWFDHPVQIGTPPESNEILYGLNSLSSALDVEKEKGVLEREAKLDIVLSVSVTHRGLHGLHRQYIRNEIKKVKSFDNLRIYAFSEQDTEQLLEEVILPMAQEYFPGRDSGVLTEVFGVDGEYGRHYSFLKAIAVLWKLCVKPNLKGTFKIDLDQVFYQEKLLEETSKTALEHLCTPLWGATGRDSRGNKISLGMIAGALVNEKDASDSIFTPDVHYKKEEAAADKIIFCSPKPQALSTEAEMMTRYGLPGMPDGQKNCLQRIHVTGGTNGILVDSLLTYRPFTPTFIGRAEDQAYIMSILYEEKNKALLRYVHKDGLIMRHDKEAFAGEAIEAARLGKMVGDYVRILQFSAYARSLPWGEERIKEELKPFTGSFISPIPVTITLLRAALKTCSLGGQIRTSDEAEAFITMIAERLQPLVIQVHSDRACLEKQVSREREAWNLFYDVCEKLLDEQENPSSVAQKYIINAGNIIKGTCIHS